MERGELGIKKCNVLVNNRQEDKNQSQIEQVDKNKDKESNAFLD